MSYGNITEVRLLSVPLENDYIHTLYFDSLSAQTSYFASKIVKSGTNFSYQRKDNFIRYPAQYDSLLGCNYVMYRNSAYSNKWFYAFITKMEYIDDGRTDIYIETDVIQTWLFDYDVKPSFIEREHVASDRVGEHTVPEMLESGEYICNKHSMYWMLDDYDLTVKYIVVGVTSDKDGNMETGLTYDGIYSGVRYYAFKDTADGKAQLNAWLQGYPKEGRADSIICMFLMPETLINVNGIKVEESSSTRAFYINEDSGRESNRNMDFSYNTLNGYTPRNKKLMSYPYRYLLVSNNAGTSVPFKYELFTENLGGEEVNGIKEVIEPQFRIDSVLCPGGSAHLMPLNYKGDLQMDEECIPMGKFPILNWTSDMYTNWLTQNAVNIGISAVSGAGSVILGAGMMATGGGALFGGSMIASGLSGIASSVAQVYQHSMMSPQSKGNLNTGDVVTAMNRNTFHFYDMSIKSEYAHIIDQFFDMFGYKVNRVKKPSFAHRRNWWYTKTIDVNIDGAIPTEDMSKIKECYNKGITFWMNPANIGNYGVANDIIG